MALGLSILFGVLAYENHKRKRHGIAIFFDACSVLFIVISLR